MSVTFNENGEPEYDLQTGDGNDRGHGGWAPGWFRKNAHELSVGGGLYRDAQTELMTGMFRGGHYKNADGGERHGFETSLQVFKGQYDGGGGESSEFDVLDVNAGANYDDSTAQLGIQANAGGFAHTWGDSDPTHDDDRSLRAGLSAGCGFGGRVHYGDKDGDKRPEYGFGFDLGPVTFDYKTEDPLHDLSLGLLGGDSKNPHPQDGGGGEGGGGGGDGSEGAGAALIAAVPEGVREAAAETVAPVVEVAETVAEPVLEVAEAAAAPVVDVAKSLYSWATS